MSAVLTPMDGFPDERIAQLRMPPHSIEAESSVLGALLLDNTAWDRVGDMLTDGDFYRYEHRLVYAAIAGLINACKPADVVTVFEALQSTGKHDEAGGLAYLNSLGQYVPSASNIRRYAEIVRERSVLRKLVSAADEIATTAFNTQGTPVDEILDRAQQKIFAVGETGAPRDDWESADTGIVLLLDRVQAGADGETPSFIPTGLRDLDEKLDGGMRDGELIVLAARPGMGKSALALTIGQNVATAGHQVGFLSMEMPKAEVRNRQLSMSAHIHLSKVKRPERLNDLDWSNLSRAVDEIRHLPLYVSDQSNLNINQVRLKARALKRRHGLRLLIVDYLGLMAGTDHKAPRAYQLEEATKGLKALAKELGMPVVLLAQVSREVEKRPDPMPILSDLRDTGAAEQDADIVIFIHRPIESKPELNAEWKYYAKLSIAKQRNGAKGYLHMTYVGENVRFMDWPEGQGAPSNGVRVKGGDL